jgi:putative transposase
MIVARIDLVFQSLPWPSDASAGSSEDEVQQLQALASSRSLPHSIVQRAQIVLACGAGETTIAIAKRMRLTGLTVGKWHKRNRVLGLEGLHN